MESQSATETEAPVKTSNRIVDWLISMISDNPDNYFKPLADFHELIESEVFSTKPTRSEKNLSGLSGLTASTWRHS